MDQIPTTLAELVTQRINKRAALTKALLDGDFSTQSRSEIMAELDLIHLSLKLFRPNDTPAQCTNDINWWSVPDLLNDTTCANCGQYAVMHWTKPIGY